MTPVLILHGWGSSSKSFEEISRILSEKGCQVFAPDLPGFGSPKAPDNPWPLDEYVHFVLNFARAQDLNKFVLMGHSFGGRIGIKFAVKYPEKLSGLILYAAAGIKPKGQAKKKFFLIAAKIGNAIFSLPVLHGLKDFMKKILYRFTGSTDYYRANGVMKEVMKKVIAEDLTPLLPNIKIPTLIIWGSGDRITPLADAKLMENNIKDSELVIMDNLGHSAHKEQAEKFTEIVLSFLAKH